METQLEKIKEEITSVEAIKGKIDKKRNLSKEVEDIQRALQPLEGKHKEFQNNEKKVT